MGIGVARLIAISLLLVGCGRDQDRDPAAVETFEFPRSVDQIEPWLDAARARSRDAHCERPLLGGEPIDGRADEAMLALIDLDGPAGPCLSALHETRAERQGRKPARPKDAIQGFPAPHGAVLTTVARACEAVPALVDAAIRHRDACSPLRPGARERDYGLSLEILNLVYGLDARAAQLAATDDAAAAVRALLDGLRLMHDFRRGTVSMLEVMIASAGERAMLERLAVLLAEEPLPREVLDDVATRLEVLWQTRPRPADAIAGDRISTLALLVDGNHFEVLLWKLPAVALQYSRIEEACPSGATVAACQRGFAALAGESRPRSESTVMPWLFLQETAVDYQLAGLRIHVATLQGAACDPSAVPPALISPPELGEPIGVRAVSPGVSDLTIPYRKHLVRAEDVPIVVWRVRCPF